MALSSLKPSMRTLGALLITLSFITPASSVFIIAPGVVQQAGTGAFLAFVIAAVVGIFIAFVYAELASAFPLAGGEYAIVGRVMGTLWGTVTLGTNLIASVLMIAVISVGIGAYIKPIFPDLNPVTAGIVTLILTTSCAILHIRTNAFVTGAFLSLELLALAVLTYLGMSHTERSLTDLIYMPVHLVGNDHLEPSTSSMLGLATAVAIWAYNGYGQAVYLGEEIHNAPKRIARTIFLALMITIIAEAVPVTAVLLGAPDLQELLASPSMLSDFITLRGGEELSTIFSLGIALAIFNALIAATIMVARIIFSTGRDQVWSPKINKALTRIHPRFGSPWVATLVCGVLAIAACFINQNLLFVITGTSLVFIYALLCVAVIMGRRNGTTNHAAYKMPFYPLAPLTAMGVMFYVVYANFLDPDVGRPSLVATMGMVIASALYYGLVLRRRGGLTLRGTAPKEF